MKVKVIEKKYKVLKQIGSGMSCTVYLAEHRQLHHKCAVKCIEKTQERSNIFLREAEFLRNLNHLYAPVLYDCEEDTQYYYLIEEYIEGQSLYNLGNNRNCISQDRLVELAIKICEAVQWLHERKPYPVLHLDLKPEHIMIASNGVKLLDFGSAVHLKGENIYGSIMGTAGFASPEVLRGEKINEHSDIYSIGAILYWLMTGSIVDYTKGFQEADGYWGEWNAIVEKCLQYEQEKRYNSVKILIEDIRSAIKSPRRLDKSFTIAVTGSQSRIGTTHFSIGMSISCRKLGIRCLYEEKNDSGAIQQIYNHCDSATEKKGVYYLPGFQAIPKYGKAIAEDKYNSEIFVQDYGPFDYERMEEYERADCVIVIVGGKEWELEQTKNLIERYRKRKDLYVVMRATGLAEFRRIKREIGMHNMFQMPEYVAPFSVRKKEQNFYRALLKHILNGRTRSINSSEEKWTKKLYSYSWNRWCR